MAATGTIRAERLRIELHGAVQGVGFRPAVHRLADEMNLSGWVRNSAVGLEIEVEGSPEQLKRFVRQLHAKRPAAAVVTAEELSKVELEASDSFEILPSDENRAATAAILPDLAMCGQCQIEMLDAGSRRSAYAFTNCTQCGPRYTIVADIPYDRINTTMQKFSLCRKCREEYTSVSDRRFHAEAMCCPECGPRLWSQPGQADGDAAIAAAASALAQGEVVAVKGVGGFQLMVDARNAAAVARLRERKAREAKPFAVLMANLEIVRQCCEVSDAEAQLLTSAAAPIVLLKAKQFSGVASKVANSSPYLGVMLPCSPLHHQLVARCGFPVVATSGNRSDEPISIDNEDALRRLGTVADLFLLHDRPIARHCDDSVARITMGRMQVLRRARGYAPLPVIVRQRLPRVLAVGGYLKNTIAIALERQVILSQHIGDLNTLEARQAFEHAIADLCRLYRFEPEIVACDLHPDYPSTQWALASGLPVVSVQHHRAHLASCAAENGVSGDYLGIAWDGTGLGLDGTIWGGEFFLVRGGQFERVAHLRGFPIPGGDAASKDCSRAACGLLWETRGRAGAESIGGAAVCKMLERGINAPFTSSIGRLFDAVSYLGGAAWENRFEGEVGMRLESLARSFPTRDSYKIVQHDNLGDWSGLVEEVLTDRKKAKDPAYIASKFHNALASWILQVAERTRVPNVVLSGGVFQNAYLTELASELLEQNGFRVFTHRQVPPNDGGLSLGQAVLAGQLAKE